MQLIGLGTVCLILYQSLSLHHRIWPEIPIVWAKREKVDDEINSAYITIQDTTDDNEYKIFINH